MIYPDSILMYYLEPLFTVVKIILIFFLGEIVPSLILSTNNECCKQRDVIAGYSLR